MNYVVQIPELRAARWKQRLSAEQLATRLEISLSWYRTIERAPALASPELLERVALALGLSPASLVGPRIVAGK
jgi:transcriptional regulator with XRE-family HTH domain